MRPRPVGLQPTDSITCPPTHLVCLPSFLPFPEQVATDALQSMERAMTRDGILTNDRQLACARINSQVRQLAAVVLGLWWRAATGLHLPFSPTCWQPSHHQPSTYLHAPHCLSLTSPPPHCPCACLRVQEGQDYLTAMACAANYAWVNRSSMTFLCRQAFAKMFDSTPDDRKGGRCAWWVGGRVGGRVAG